MSDRDSWHPTYALLRLAGIRTIVVHHHTAGGETRPAGIKLVLKRIARLFRPAMANVVLAVSDFVRQRKIEIDLIPANRVLVALNSVEIPDTTAVLPTRELFEIPDDRPLIICACRAAEYKGVQHLLHAIDLLADRLPLRPVLLYFGNGPYFDELEAQRSTLRYPDDVIFAGYRPDVSSFFGAADLCVVPSTCEEAFGLAALEPAARGVPVVASAVGGIPEVVVDGETGLLIPPASPEKLADAISSLLTNPGLRKTMGENARSRAEAIFSRETHLNELTSLFRREMNFGEMAVISLDLGIGAVQLEADG